MGRIPKQKGCSGRSESVKAGSSSEKMTMAVKPGQRRGSGKLGLEKRYADLKVELEDIERKKDDVAKEMALIKPEFERAKHSKATQRKSARLPQSQAAKLKGAPVIYQEVGGSLTVQGTLCYGLRCSGFGVDRQERVQLETNMKRFKAFYGVSATTAVPFLSDLQRDNNDISIKDCLMTMNWLYLYDSYEVLSGRWGYKEGTIGTKVIEHAKKMQRLKPKKIKFEFGDRSGSFWASLDGVKFVTNEFGLTPSTTNYNFKSNTAGVGYLFGLAIEEPRIVCVDGPYNASRSDICIFRGSKNSKEKKEHWNENALYFKVPEGKKVVGDGGFAGEPSKITTKSRQHPKEMRDWISRVLARQETLHTRLKSFNIVGHRFRHGNSTEKRYELHKMALDAVSVIIQYDYENGHPPFDV
ncbi:hypothetical protein ACHAWF_007685 [Thalassiosira exigua]